jgi:predicted SnoaL-like aldol condensation-catalyzing enzyme
MHRSAFLCIVVALVMLSGAAFADSDPQAANKKTVVAFYEAAINQKDFAAASQFIGPRYTQHNPNAADGPEGFKRFIEFLREKFPNAHSEIKKVFADGDYVILHVRAVREPGTRGNAIVDIFKLENGKIVEHWDVVQPIPDQSANNNGMF